MMTKTEIFNVLKEARYIIRKVDKYIGQGSSVNQYYCYEILEPAFDLIVGLPDSEYEIIKNELFVCNEMIENAS